MYSVLCQVPLIAAFNHIVYLALHVCADASIETMTGIWLLQMHSPGAYQNCEVVEIVVRATLDVYCGCPGHVESWPHDSEGHKHSGILQPPSYSLPGSLASLFQPLPRSFVSQESRATNLSPSTKLLASFQPSSQPLFPWDSQPGFLIPEPRSTFTCTRLKIMKGNITLLQFILPCPQHTILFWSSSHNYARILSRNSFAWFQKIAVFITK